MIEPFQDWVLVGLIKNSPMSIGGIIIPETSQKKGQKGKVLAVGPGIYPGCPKCNNKLRPPDVKLDDIVFFGKFSGIEVDKSLLMIRDADILAIIETSSDGCLASLENPHE